MTRLEEECKLPPKPVKEEVYVPNIGAPSVSMLSDLRSTASMRAIKLKTIKEMQKDSRRLAKHLTKLRANFIM